MKRSWKRAILAEVRWFLISIVIATAIGFGTFFYLRAFALPSLLKGFQTAGKLAR